MSIAAFEIIEQLLNDIMKEIKDDMKAQGMYATGKTESLFEVQMKGTKTGVEGILLGPSYMHNLIVGRGPSTKSGGETGQTLQQSILEWIKAKGITPDEPNMSQESLSWAISKHMHKKGNQGVSPSGLGRFAGGKNTGLLANHISESRIESVIDLIGEAQQELFIKDLNEQMR